MSAVSGAVSRPSSAEARDLLLRMAHAAIASVAPGACVAAHLPEPPVGKTVVIGAGKAAAAMALAVEESWAAATPLEGVVVTRHGHRAPCRRIEVIEAAHPVPDGSSLAAADRILAAVRGLTRNDLVLALLSGGASALLAAPASGLTLADKQAVTRALLRCGAPIREINTVRKHLSAIKGGRLAAACAPARVITLAISDVPGDDPAVIGSGPTVADPTTCAEARGVLERFHIDLTEPVRRHLADGAEETPKPGDPRLQRNTTAVIAGARQALEAAAAVAQRAGVAPVILGDALEGEAAVLGAEHARRALALAGAVSSRGPCVLLSGGETTVTVRGPGRGGRNSEYLLAAILALQGHPAVHVLALDTDGIDGVGTNAGAVAGPGCMARARALGIDGAACLAANDALRFFEATGDLVVTGPTRTNVNDFRALLILPPPG